MRTWTRAAYLPVLKMKSSHTILVLRELTGPRRATFRLVTPEVARDGIVLLPAGIDIRAHQRAGSPFIWCHDTSSPDSVIGRVVEYRQSPQALDIVVEFTDDGPQGLASRCWQKVQAGLINSVSVAANVVASEKRQIGGREVVVATRSELQEASLVIVGADRGAVRLDRAAVLRALDNLKEKTAMDKAALCKMLGIEETADRETAEAACMKYLVATEDGEARKAAAAALDEYFKEEAPAAPSTGDPPAAERGAGEAPAEGKDEEVEAMRAANAELQRALAAAQAASAAAPKPDEVAAATVKREAALAADVDKWITEGRARRDERSTWLERHRKGKAANVIRHIPKGAWTSGQRLAGGQVGTPVTDLPAAPETQIKREARGVVEQARSMDRNGQPKPAATSDDKTEAKRLVEQARGGLRSS